MYRETFFRLHHFNLVPSLRPIRGSRTNDHPSSNSPLAYAAIQVTMEDEDFGGDNKDVGSDMMCLCDFR